MQTGKQYLEIGKIINTHGVRGELKVEPWADSPEALAGIRRLRDEDGTEYRASVRPNGRFLIIHLQGIDSVEDAMKLRGHVLSADRRSIPCPEGSWFVQDLLGLTVLNEDGTELGLLEDVLEYPAGAVYLVRGAAEHLIPEKGGFIQKVDLEAGRITVRLIEGM